MFPILITGSQSSGKTKLVNMLVADLNGRGINFDGILSHAVLDNSGVKTEFIIRRISDNKELLLCSRNIQSQMKTQNFSFNADAFSLGQDFISNKIQLPSIFFLDEIGILEARGEGWFSLINYLLLSETNCIFCVRKNAIPKIISAYPFQNYEILDLDDIENLNKVKNDILLKFENF